MAKRRSVTVVAAWITGTAVLCAAVVAGIFDLASHRNSYISVDLGASASDSTRTSDKAIKLAPLGEVASEQPMRVAEKVKELPQDKQDMIAKHEVALGADSAEDMSSEVATLIRRYKQRADIIRSHMDSVDSLNIRRKESSEVMQRNQIARLEFEKLHKKHIEALRAGNFSYAKELEDEIERVLESISVSPIGGGGGSILKHPYYAPL